MNRSCTICKVTSSNYKCPICLVYYCSVACCNKHRMDKCDLVQPDKKSKEKKSSITIGGLLFPTGDTVKPDKLQRLAKSKGLKDILSNSHLCALLSSVNDAENAESAMANAMQVPIFVEFANACLEIVENDDCDR